jgi:hypothetical protein
MRPDEGYSSSVSIETADVSSMSVFGTPPPTVQSIIGATSAPVPTRARLASEETKRERARRAATPGGEVRDAVDIVEVTELDEARAVTGGNDEETNQQRREHDALPHPDAERPRLDIQA